VAPDTVNEQTSTLLTPLYLACQYGSLETIQILSSHGANFKLRDENGLNCLHAGFIFSFLKIIISFCKYFSLSKFAFSCCSMAGKDKF
jgi:ankyrin repeat protein